MAGGGAGGPGRGRVRFESSSGSAQVSPPCGGGGGPDTGVLLMPRRGRRIALISVGILCLPRVALAHRLVVRGDAAQAAERRKGLV